MKHPIFLAALLLFAGAGFNCRPSNPTSSELLGKLVVNAPCGHFVVQVLGGDADPSRLVKSWKDSVRDTTYTNVFAVANACHFDGAGFPANSIFRFRMNDTVIVNNCMLCMIAYPAPAISNTVSHVQLVEKGQ